MIIHPLSDVMSSNIGVNTYVWQYAVILQGAVIGANCNINCHTFIENDVLIGDNVTIKSGVYVWDGIIIENNVFVGSSVTFTNDRVPRSRCKPEEFLKTKVEEGASIGANSTIIGGLTIGKCSFIGAASLVTKNIPPFTMWYGSPAKHKGYVTKEGTILDLDLKDKLGNQYILLNNEPQLT